MPSARSTFPWRRGRLASSVLMTAALACSASKSPASATTPYLSGTYKAVTAGPIAEITFYLGDHYALVDGQCADALLGGTRSAADGGSDAAALVTRSCNEFGTYVLGADGGSLTLSPVSGPPRTLPFQPLMSAVAYAGSLQGQHAGAGVHLLGGGVSLSGGDASLTSGSDAALTGEAGVSLVRCPGAALSSQGTPLTRAFRAGGQSLTGGGPSGTPDPTAGGNWSCDGTYDSEPSSAYYLTTFGCSSSSPAFSDPGDNCCSQGAAIAYAAGLCGGVSTTPSSNCPNTCQSSESCQSWRSTEAASSSSTAEGYAANFACEAAVNWYSTGGNVYGFGTRLCLSTPAGKGVVVFVTDDGPACSIEQRVNAHVLDVSPPTGNYLFGESQISATERKAAFATQVSASTPLGPNDGCVAGALGDAGAAGAGVGIDAGASGEAASDGGSDAGCSPLASCASDSDCNPGGPLGMVCAGGACQAGCHTSAQCASGTTCVQAAQASVGTCQGTAAGEACSNDGTCNPGGSGAGLVCSGGRCIPGCHASYECPGNTRCESGQCED